MRAGANHPPPFDTVSPKTAVPKTMLANSVTALLDAMAGASTPVFRADC